MEGKGTVSTSLLPSELGLPGILWPGLRPA